MTFTYFTTIYAPTIVDVYTRYKARKNAKIASMIRYEVKKQLKAILND